jgi:hypothetical protein
MQFYFSPFIDDRKKLLSLAIAILFFEEKEKNTKNKSLYVKYYLIFSFL